MILFATEVLNEQVFKGTYYFQEQQAKMGRFEVERDGRSIKIFPAVNLPSQAEGRTAHFLLFNGRAGTGGKSRTWA